MEAAQAASDEDTGEGLVCAYLLDGRGGGRQIGWDEVRRRRPEDGLLWVSNGQGVIGVDRETLQVQQTWNAAGSYGVSIDFEGYVWTVASGSTASKIDPATGQFWTYNGLVGAYTYSDMTGYALVSVGNAAG